MTKEEAILEMRFCGVNESNIDIIIEKCKQKNILPQYLDNELEKLRYERFFHFEYDDNIDDGYQTPSHNKKHSLSD
ncbi:MAG: hypothetical protein LBJ88_00090 [Campylobacteraceae bacterium]|jgi:hypothetical protein|nr:hypothetical protein [Campylobacteraceae bacterium]